jgi:salicylate hydroxylase
MSSRSIAVIGAGIGGLASAIALRQAGVTVHVFEQAPVFRRIGAAINLTPNAVKVLDGLGLGAALRRRAFSPTHRVSRTWDTGAETSRLEMGRLAEARYGSPQLMTHRADLLSALEDAVPPETVHLGTKLADLRLHDDGVALAFEDGGRCKFDAVVGADGIHSTVRHLVFADAEPSYTGMIAYRCIFPVSRLDSYDTHSFVKWWGPTSQSQLVTAAINRGEDLFVFATRAEPESLRESWSAECDIDELRSSFAGYHAEAQAVLAACDTPLKTALYIREPMPTWAKGRVALLGDACHPMVPFMAQGAAMVLEDVAVLARCLASIDEIDTAFACYAATRRERASLIQRASSENDWLRKPANADWLYGYDAHSTPLVAIETT